jgi:predicted Abi (CAAX) family protease
VATSLLWWADGWAWVPPSLVLWSSFAFEWAFAFVLLDYAFCKAHFSEFLDLYLQNIFVPKLVEMLVVKSYI